MSKKNEGPQCCSEPNEGAIPFTAKPYFSIFSEREKHQTYCSECGRELPSNDLPNIRIPVIRFFL